MFYLSKLKITIYLGEKVSFKLEEGKITYQICLQRKVLKNEVLLACKHNQTCSNISQPIAKYT